MADSVEIQQELEFENSLVTFECGPVGTIAKIERGTEKEYAGPLPKDTVDSLLEVSRRCR